MNHILYITSTTKLHTSYEVYLAVAYIPPALAPNDYTGVLIINTDLV